MTKKFTLSTLFWAGLCILTCLVCEQQPVSEKIIFWNLILLVGVIISFSLVEKVRVIPSDHEDLTRVYHGCITGDITPPDTGDTREIKFIRDWNGRIEKAIETPLTQKQIDKVVRLWRDNDGQISLSKICETAIGSKSGPRLHQIREVINLI